MNTQDSTAPEEAAAGFDKKQEPPFFNCHTHIFNFEHVHKSFLKSMIPLWVGVAALVVAALLGYFICEIINQFMSSNWVWIILKGLLAIVLLLISILLVLVFLYSIMPVNIHKMLRGNRTRRITKVLKKAIPGEFDSLVRYANFILHAYDTEKGKPKPQQDILEDLISYFPRKTRFVVLSMDMDYMLNTRKPIANSTFYQQLNDLRVLKNHPDYQEILFPFIHADPRRLSKDKEFFGYLKNGLLSGEFSGIKLYPPLGYFPFDIRLKPVYDLALEHDLPITIHCSVGPVYYRSKIRTLQSEGYFEGKEFKHPFTGKKLKGRRARSFTPHFTHPLNYYFLMNCHRELSTFWKQCIDNEVFDLAGLPMGDLSEEHLKQYKNLKICLGHYGGSLEWRRYMDNAWFPRERIDLSDPSDIKNIIHAKNGMWKYQVYDDQSRAGRSGRNLKAMNWFSIISELLVHKDNNGNASFPNLYADISYNLSDQRMHPLLKVRLDTDDQIRKKVLFGTDFYMVAMQMTERRATINMRAFIGEENFRQIAIDNPQAFLATSIGLTNHN